MIAVSKDEVQDVTWRYSADHATLKTRRTLVREQWLTAMLLNLTNRRQETYGESTKRSLTGRRLRELVDLMSPKDKSKLTKEELLGRQSGSAAWRTARGELGLGAAAPANIVWRLTQEEKDSMTFHLEYDIVKVGWRRNITVSFVSEILIKNFDKIFRMNTIALRRATAPRLRVGQVE